MTYAFDPELTAIVEMLPQSDFGDVQRSRAGLAALIEPLNANVDTTGLDIDDREIPGPEGGPQGGAQSKGPDMKNAEDADYTVVDDEKDKK